MEILGIIPARGGSKGVPRKNIRLFAGRPLMAYSAQAANDSGVLGRLILSTDDGEIAAVGRELGIEVPFLRPPELATDEADAISVFRHALNSMMAEGYNPDFVLVLQPTSPLREGADIRSAVLQMKQGGFDQLISVAPVSQHPYWMKTVEDHIVKPYLDTKGPFRRQDLPPLFIPNGAIYLYKSEFLLEPPEVPVMGAMVMESWKSLDIDNPLDFFLAERLMEAIKQGQKPWEK